MNIKTNKVSANVFVSDMYEKIDKKGKNIKKNQKDKKFGKMKKPLKI